MQRIILQFVHPGKTATFDNINALRIIHCGLNNPWGVPVVWGSTVPNILKRNLKNPSVKFHSFEIISAKQLKN